MEQASGNAQEHTANGHAPDHEALLKETAEKLNTGSLKERRAALTRLTEVLSEGPVTPDLFKGAAYVAVVALPPRVSSRRPLDGLARQLVSPLGRAAKEEGEFAPFLAKLHTKAVKKLTTGDPRAFAVAVRLFLLFLLEGDPDAFLADTFVAAALQASLTNIDLPTSLQPSVLTPLLHLMARSDKAVAIMTKIVDSKDPPPVLLVTALARRISHAAKRRLGGADGEAERERAGEVRAAVAKRYCACVLEAKKRAPPETQAAFRPIFNVLTEQDFGEVMVPVIVKYLKRNPDNLLTYVIELTNLLQIDISTYARPLLGGAVFELLKASSAETREHAMQLCCSVASQCSDGSAIEGLLCELMSTLEGGSLSQAPHRLAYLEAMLALTVAPCTRSERQKYARTLLSGSGGAYLLKCCKSESSEDARAAGIKLTGVLMRLEGVTKDACHEYAKVLGGILADKKASDRLKEATVEALVSMMCAKERFSYDLSALQELIDPLVAILPQATAKHTKRGLCVDVWRVLLNMDDVQLDGVANRIDAKAMTILTDKGSYLNTRLLIHKASARELQSQLRFLVQLLNRRPPVFGGVDLCPAPANTDIASDAFRLPPSVHESNGKAAGWTGLHWAFVNVIVELVQKGAISDSRDKQRPFRLHAELASLSDFPALGTLLLLAFYNLLAHINKEAPPPWGQPLPPQQENGHKHHIDTPHPGSLRYCLTAILRICGRRAPDSDPTAPPPPPGMEPLGASLPHVIGPDLTAVALLCMCHPLTGSCDVSRMQYVKMMVREWGDFPHWGAVRRAVAKGGSIEGKDVTGYRDACLAVIETFRLLKAESMATASSCLEAAEGLCGDLTSQLYVDDICGEDPEHLPIYFAPEGILYVEEGVYIAQAVEQKNVKRNKHLTALYGEDYDPSQIPSKPSAAPKPSAKGGAGGGKKPSAAGAPHRPLTKKEIEEHQLNEQTEIRRRIQRTLDHSTYAIDGLARLCRAHPEAFGRQAGLIVPQLQRLLGSPLTVMATLKALRVMADVLLPAAAVPHRSYLPDALVRVALQKPVDDHTIQLLATVSDRTPLPTSATALILPVVSAILSDPERAGDKACMQSLQLLALQLKLRAQMEGEEVLQCVGGALKCFPALVRVCRDILAEACSYLITDETSLTLILLADIGVTDDADIRNAVVRAMDLAPLSLLPIATYLYVFKHDPSQATAKAAGDLLEKWDIEPDIGSEASFYDFLSAQSTVFQKMTADALSHLLKDRLPADEKEEREGEGEEDGEEEEDEEESAAEAHVNQTLTALARLFVQKGGRVREGVCYALVALTKKGLITTEEQIAEMFKLIFECGMEQPDVREDPDSPLRKCVLSVGHALIEDCGKDFYRHMLEIIERQIEIQTRSKSRNEAAAMASAVYLGAVTKYIDPSDAKVVAVLDRLLDLLLDPKAPSPSVQKAVADVVAPLVKACNQAKTEAFSSQMTLEKFLEEAFTNDNATIRNGAAMGVGAIVKGLGISALKQFDLIKRLQEAAEHPKEPLRRQGALMCFEALSEALGRLFEPFVIHTLPTLLNAFSDTSIHVRNAAQKAAKSLMAGLSGHGVKMVLPTLLSKVTEKQWRTKLGSIELLASMVNCAPKQLAVSLPQVVPALADVVSDSHPKVRDSADKALKTIASVITTPEIKSLQGVLIESLVNPSDKATKTALQALLETSFVHAVDAPSLAMVCPMLTRALRERGSETKKKAAQIVASMVELMREPKDFLPYYPAIIPHLKGTLVDPIPDVRQVAAKAFGRIAGALGEEHLDDVLPWLFTTLKSSSSSVERSGAANGLSEVLVALGAEKLDEFLPLILENAANKKSAPEVREGYLGLFVYLPIAFGESFQMYVPQVLPALLRGLADESEPVRDVSFRAAEVLVGQYGATHTALLLPPLEEGIFSPDWRIRQASVSLLGTLITRILRPMDAPPSADGALQPTQDLMASEVLSRERRAFLLSSLYIVRSDDNLVVRSTAGSVWKSVVSNTPKTLKELLPILMKRLIQNLGSESREKQTVAGRCVGDLVQKLGDRVLPDLMPIFAQTLESSEWHTRRGVCIGLGEVIEAAPKALLAEYSQVLLPTVRKVLCDTEGRVRETATHCAAKLYEKNSPLVLEQVLPWLMDQLFSPPVYDVASASDTHEAILHSLELLIREEPHGILPSFYGTVLKQPYDVMKIRALGCVASATNPNVVHNSFTRILPALVDAAAINQDTQFIKENGLDVDVATSIFREEIGSTANKLFHRVTSDGAHSLLGQLGTMLQEGRPLIDRSAGGVKRDGPVEEDALNPVKRALLGSLMARFFDVAAENKVPLGEYVQVLLPVIVPVALADPDSDALAKGADALLALTKAVSKETFANYVTELRGEVFKLVSDPLSGREEGIVLDGLNLKAAVEALQPVYQQALMYGKPDDREVAAKGLGEMVKHMDPVALKPWATKLAGPLIRILGDRFPANVKAAILEALRALLDRGGATLKPFLPQLQSTFLKALGDPQGGEFVRRRSGASLGALAALPGARTEPLLNELCKEAANTATDISIRGGYMQALASVLRKLPSAAPAAVRPKVEQTAFQLLKARDNEETTRQAAADALAALIGLHMDQQEADKVLSEDIIYSFSSSDAATREGMVLAAAALLALPQGWDKIIAADVSDRLVEGLTQVISSGTELPRTKRAALKAFANLCKLAKLGGDDGLKARDTCVRLLPAISELLKAKTLPLAECLDALKGMKRLCKHPRQPPHPDLLTTVVPPLYLAIRGTNPAAKLLGERGLFYGLRVRAEQTRLISDLPSWVFESEADRQFLVSYTQRVLARFEKDTSDTEVSDGDGGNE